MQGEPCTPPLPPPPFPSPPPSPTLAPMDTEHAQQSTPQADSSVPFCKSNPVPGDRALSYGFENQIDSPTPMPMYTPPTTPHLLPRRQPLPSFEGAIPRGSPTPQAEGAGPVLPRRRAQELFHTPPPRPFFPIWDLFRAPPSRHSSPIWTARLEPATGKQAQSRRPLPKAGRKHESKLSRSWRGSSPVAGPRRPRHGGAGKNAQNDTIRLEHTSESVRVVGRPLAPPGVT